LHVVQSVREWLRARADRAHNVRMTRVADHPIEPFFLSRWSSRAMSGEPLVHGEVERLIEAARYAPSSGNGQPWTFFVAHKTSPVFSAWHDGLADGNKPWCARASAFILLCATTVRDNGAPARLALFDCGAAWMSLALQGSALGLVVHAMEGYDVDKIRAAAGIADPHVVTTAMIAVGKPGDASLLSDKLQTLAQPNQRKPIASFVRVL
jgi:nitroreductase